MEFRQALMFRARYKSQRLPRRAESILQVGTKPRLCLCYQREQKRQCGNNSSTSVVWTLVYIQRMNSGTVLAVRARFCLPG